MSKSVIIIGGGLGGLECGYILAKNGMKVTILEQAMQVGGCLQSFRRGETYFDTGFHCVSGLKEGQPLHKPFRYLDLLDLPWIQIQDEPIGLKIHLTTSTSIEMLQHIQESNPTTAWRLKGGGQTIVNHLVNSIQSMGGRIITKAQVTDIIEQDKHVKAVVINHTEELSSDYFISDIHPISLFKLLSEDSIIRKAYQKRIAHLPNSFGMFTAHIRLKSNTIPYQDRNIIVKTDEADLRNLQSGKTQVVMIHFYPDQPAIDILSPMFWNDVQKWENTTVGKRGEEYRLFKQHKLAACITLAEQALPNLRTSIEEVFTSTPLTWRDYTSTHQGAAYGILKDGTAETMIPIRTKLSNLFLTGQNVNFHSVFGVTITAFETCKEILNTNYPTF